MGIFLSIGSGEAEIHLLTRRDLSAECYRDCNIPFGCRQEQVPALQRVICAALFLSERQRNPKRNTAARVDKPRGDALYYRQEESVSDWPSDSKYFYLVTAWVPARRLLLFVVFVETVSEKRGDRNHHKDDLTNLRYRQCDCHICTPFQRG